MFFQSFLTNGVLLFLLFDPLIIVFAVFFPSLKPFFSGFPFFVVAFQFLGFGFFMFCLKHNFNTLSISYGFFEWISFFFFFSNLFKCCNDSYGFDIPSSNLFCLQFVQFSYFFMLGSLFPSLSIAFALSMMATLLICQMSYFSFLLTEFVCFF